MGVQLGMSPYVDGKGRRWVGTSPEIRQHARRMRQEMTKAERVLWSVLRDRRFMNLKFRRQHPSGPYIFDFFCRELHLVIEVDGSIHLDPIQAGNDRERDAYCSTQGLTVLRFTNHQVLSDLASVVQKIRDQVPPS